MSSFEPNALFFAGDLGQRIFQQPFSWKSLGVDIRGRARTLHINYRTSHQIRKQSDQLLAPEIIDVDGNEEQRQGTISVFDGPPPSVKTFDTESAEINAVADWLIEMVNDKKVTLSEIALIVRSDNELDRAVAAIELAKLPFKVLDDHVETTSGYVSIATMPLVKGLEFKAVVIMACDDEVIPSQKRIENVTDDADLEDVYNTERHLLYVACTRARDYLMLTSLKPSSEFLVDFES
jgi:superfamily I DNA/RNA helicase